MTNMQRLVFVLAIILAILLGVLIATTFFDGSSHPSPSPTPVALASPTPSSSGSAGPSASSSPSAPAGTAAPSTSAAPTAKPAPTPTPIPAATITFSDLKLDAATDASGLDRIVTWSTRSTRPITVQFTTTASTGNAALCLYVGTSSTAVSCKTGTSGKITANVTGSIVAMTLRMRGSGGSTPLVAVTIGFTAINPSVTIKNARFDGTAAPDYNGLQVVMTPRKAGSVKVVASWGGHPFQYEVDLIEQGGSGLTTLTNQGPSTNVSKAFPVTMPNPWMIVLKNAKSGFGITGMTATYTWP